MNIELRILKLLKDMQKACNHIMYIVNKESHENFIQTSSWKNQDIIAREITILGEAATKLNKDYPEFCNKYSGIPFREIIDMRIIIENIYNNIDWNIVWNVAQNDIPKFLTQINILIEDINKENN